MNKALSWKFLIPFGLVWLLIFHGGVLALVGTISLLLGIVDAVRQAAKKHNQ